jgi:hypothetical protein
MRVRLVVNPLLKIETAQIFSNKIKAPSQPDDASSNLNKPNLNY